MGSEVGESSSISTVSAVARIVVAMDEDGVDGVRLLERNECLFDALVAGRRGHVCES